MKNFVSMFALVFSKISLALSIFTSLPWAFIVISQNGWGAVFYWLFVTPWIGGAALFLGLVPSSILYARFHEQRDLSIVKWSAAAVVIVAAESALLLVVPLHGS